MSKQDRQGVRTAADLEQKYQFGRKFSEIMGLLDDSRGAISKVESELRHEILEQYTYFERDTERIVLGAKQEIYDHIDGVTTEYNSKLEVAADGITAQANKYVDDKNADLVSKYDAAIQVNADKISSEVEKTTKIGDTVAKLNSRLEQTESGITGKVSEAVYDATKSLEEAIGKITKYFTFDINGLTIGQVDNPNKVVIDNDDITIISGDKIIQTFKADGTALIPIVKITEKLDLLGLQITKDETHINCDYVEVVEVNG